MLTNSRLIGGPMVMSTRGKKLPAFLTTRLHSHGVPDTWPPFIHFEQGNWSPKGAITPATNQQPENMKIINPSSLALLIAASLCSFFRCCCRHVQSHALEVPTDCCHYPFRAALGWFTPITGSSNIEPHVVLSCFARSGSHLLGIWFFWSHV